MLERRGRPVVWGDQKACLFVMFLQENATVDENDGVAYGNEE
jgi:hypothetical protein